MDHAGSLFERAEDIATGDRGARLERRDESPLRRGVERRRGGARPDEIAELFGDAREWPADATWYPRNGKDKVIKFAEKFANDTQESIETFYRCLREGKEPPSNVTNGRMATLTGMLVRKAVYENRRVEMKELLKG